MSVAPPQGTRDHPLIAPLSSPGRESGPAAGFAPPDAAPASPSAPAAEWAQPHPGEIDEYTAADIQDDLAAFAAPPPQTGAGVWGAPGPWQPPGMPAAWAPPPQPRKRRRPIVVAAIACLATLGVVFVTLIVISVLHQPSEAGNRYPSQARAGFLAGCTRGPATEAQCECVLRELEARVSFDSFRQVGEAGVGRTFASLPPDMQDAVIACR